MATVMGGRPGTIVASTVVVFRLLFACASSAVTLSIIFNTISQHAMCNVGFIGISYIIAASLIVTISVGLKGPFQAPENFKVELVLVGNPSFHQVINAILRMIFVFLGKHFLATGLANAHVGIKYVYVEIMQRMKMTHEITANSVRSWTVWFPCASVFWVLCCVISNAIPIFDSIFLFWLHMNRGIWFQGWRKKVLFCLNATIIGLVVFLNLVGLWASIKELLDQFKKESGVQGPFDCGDNAYF
ncbi:hypothetical protein ACJ41O_003118 [Fusarium nematophilum]